MKPFLRNKYSILSASLDFIKATLFSSNRFHSHLRRKSRYANVVNIMNIYIHEYLYCLCLDIGKISNESKRSFGITVSPKIIRIGGGSGDFLKQLQLNPWVTGKRVTC